MIHITHHMDESSGKEERQRGTGEADRERQITKEWRYVFWVEVEEREEKEREGSR